MSGTRKGLVGLFLVPLLALAAWGAAQQHGLLIPTWVSWEQSSLSADLDGDGTPEEVQLGGRRLTVSSPDGQRDRTPHAWRISDVLVADVTGDGTPELVMLAWRRGNYGSSRPFWDTGPDLRMTEHLYVMGWRDGALVPVWMGHELGREVMGFSFDDQSRLLTLTERDGTRTNWIWEGFGFLAAEGT